MSLLDSLSEEACWNQFYNYKTSLICHTPFEKRLREFIDNRSYIPVMDMISSGSGLSLPRKAVINKNSSQKKRIVYMYPEGETIVLKLLTYLVIRKYDHLFCRCLYSFRPGLTAKDAVSRLSHTRDIGRMYSYKADISNYFNSIPVEKLLPMLSDVLSDDLQLYSFLSGLLTEPFVKDRNTVIQEKKGIMAGTPISSFYANLYLKELDKWFYERNIPYARYSDDIIVFAPDPETLQGYAEFIRRFLSGKQLVINPDKECFTTPDEGWSFLGFRYKSGTIDISPVTVRKIKRKMHRKSRALLRWSQRNDVSGEKAASAFIRIFNKKLLDSPDDHDLTWSCWFFSLINTDESLRVIDHYAQDCIRYIASGSRKKSRFNVRYEDMKRLGYRSLVHEYYSYSEKSPLT